MNKFLEFGDVIVDVVLKDIRTMRLSVHPPQGRVRVSVPRRISLKTVRSFVLSKLLWIKKHQKKFATTRRAPILDAYDTGMYYLWGQAYPLVICEQKGRPSIQLLEGKVVLGIRPETTKTRQKALLAAWSRQQLENAIPASAKKWEPLLGVKVKQFTVRTMRTRWGSCSPTSKRIRLSAMLSQVPMECLEYVIVHEMMHLLEPSHNARFRALMTQHLPDWKALKQRLNQRATAK